MKTVILGKTEYNEVKLGIPRKKLGKLGKTR